MTCFERHSKVNVEPAQKLDWMYFERFFENVDVELTYMLDLTIVIENDVEAA